MSMKITLIITGIQTTSKKWCLEYTIKIEEEFSKKSESKLDSREISKWKNIINNIFLPKIEGTNIFYK